MSLLLGEFSAVGQEGGALGGVVGSIDRRVVCRQCVGVAAQASQQVGADGVVQVVAVEVQRVEEGERGFGSVDLGHGDRTVEGDDRGGVVGQQLVVELHDLRPVGGGRGWGVAVDGVDRRLDLVGA